MSAAPTWARDLVLTELGRAYPEEMNQAALSDSTGVGPGDLRATIEELVDEGHVVVTDAGWAVQDPDNDEVTNASGRAAEADTAEDPRFAGQTTEWGPLAPETPTTGGEAGADEAAVTTQRVLEGGAPTGGPHRARIVLDVMFVPINDEEPMELADRFRNLAVRGVTGVFPDLQVAGTIEEVVVFDTPRRLYP